MSGIGFPNNLNPETTKVLDNRCAGPSTTTNSITFPAQGLLRYETDNDNWKYYDNTNNWVNFFTGVTYTNGEGVTISPSNVISIGQAVDETDDVTFNSVTTNLIKSGENGNIELATNTSGTVNTRLTITNTGRVGINVAANDIEEDFEIDGNMQLDTGGAQRSRIIFYDKQNDHEHAEVDGLGEGANGGILALYTKVDGSSVTEKLRINNVGAIGIGGANYGNSGQVMVSRGSGNPVEWASQTITSIANYHPDDVGAPAVAGQFGGIDLTGSVLSYVSPDGSAIRAAVSNGSLTQLVTTNLTINNAGAIGVNGGNEYGSAGDVLTSNGPASSVRWRTPVIVGASLTTNSVNGSDGSALTVVFNNVEFETVSCYNNTTGVFTTPRDAHYMVNVYARVTDFSSPGTNGNRIQSIIQLKPVGGSFYNYAVTDTVDVEANIKAGTGSSNMIIKLLVNQQIQYRVAMAGGGSWGLRGDAFELRGTYLSIHSID